LALYACETDLYQELGGFDENCFMYSDDVDLSYRMLKENRIYYPETTVIHYKGESTVKDGIYMKRFQESMQFLKKALKVSVFFSVL
jgi:GT2 family glycosyltransferase